MRRYLIPNGPIEAPPDKALTSGPKVVRLKGSEVRARSTDKKAASTRDTLLSRGKVPALRRSCQAGKEPRTGNGGSDSGQVDLRHRCDFLGEADQSEKAIEHPRPDKGRRGEGRRRGGIHPTP